MNYEFEKVAKNPNFDHNSEKWRPYKTKILTNSKLKKPTFQQFVTLKPKFREIFT